MEIIDVIKLYENDDSITVTANSILVETKNITAPQLALILASLEPSNEYVIKSSNILEIKKSNKLNITLERLIELLDENLFDIKLEIKETAFIIDGDKEKLKEIEEKLKDYNYSFDEQLVLVREKELNEKVAGNKDLKEQKSEKIKEKSTNFNPIEIAKFIDALGFKKVLVDIYNDRIEVSGVDSDTLADIAAQVDKKYPHLEIILKDDKIIIK